MNCDDKASPFASVNVCPASVYTGTSSTVPLNSSSRSAVFARSCASVKLVVPSLTNKGTNCMGLFAVAEVFLLTPFFLSLQEYLVKLHTEQANQFFS